jgi:Molybdopterin oxidoreductase
LKKVDDQWKRIGWEDALAEIADKLQRLKKEFGSEVLSIFSGSIGVESLETMEMALVTGDMMEGVADKPVLSEPSILRLFDRLTMDGLNEPH